MGRPNKKITALRAKLFTEGSYFCQKCDRVRPLGDFGNESNSRHGIRSMCKDCTNAGNYGRISKYREAMGADAWRAKRRDYLTSWRAGVTLTKEAQDTRRGYQLKRKYGITEHEFKMMLAEQDGRCAICMTPKPNKDWHVDHCHASGEVRGILCNLCNGGLGFFQDNTDALAMASIYLRARITPVATTP